MELIALFIMELLKTDDWEPEMLERERKGRGVGGEPDPTAAPLIFILFHFRYCMSCVCNERGIKRSGGDERVGQKGWRARLIRLGRQDGGMLGWMYAGELRSTFHGCLHRRGSRCPMRNGVGWMDEWMDGIIKRMGMIWLQCSLGTRLHIAWFFLKKYVFFKLLFKRDAATSNFKCFVNMIVLIKIKIWSFISLQLYWIGGEFCYSVPVVGTVSNKAFLCVVSMTPSTIFSYLPITL